MTSCEDCGTIGKLKRVDACSSAHTSLGGCCTKDVCDGLCTYTCQGCGVKYGIDCDEGWDGYYEKSICPHCQSFNDHKVAFWGDLREGCRRYCEMGCFDDCDFTLQGQPVADKENESH